MAGILLRIGIDQSAGRWNAPCCPDGRFCYVPIPDGRSSDRGAMFDRHYSEFVPFIRQLGADWPSHLSGTCHLDPDFVHLTYGDAQNRAKRIRNHLSAGDFIAFWAGLRCMATDEVICSIVGFYTVSSVANASEVGPLDSHRNAHTRYAGDPDREDVVVFARPSLSGRLWKHIQIGRYRDGAQRVDRELLTIWGGLENGDGGDWPDGYIHRSASPPIFRDAGRFLKWFWAQKPKLVHANNV